MGNTGKLALWALLSAAATGCSDSHDRPAPEADARNHYVIVTDIEVVNADSGQPVSVSGGAVFGSAQIDD